MIKYNNCVQIKQRIINKNVIIIYTKLFSFKLIYEICTMFSVHLCFLFEKNYFLHFIIIIYNTLIDYNTVDTCIILKHKFELYREGEDVEF